MMDLNLVVICGRLAAPVEVARTPTGVLRLRLLLAVSTDLPHRRLDLIPVVMWKWPRSLTDLVAGDRVWVSGMVQRRVPGESGGGRRTSEVQVVAHDVSPRSASWDLPAHPDREEFETAR